MRNENDRERNALDYGFSQSCRVTFPLLPSSPVWNIGTCQILPVICNLSHKITFI